MKFPQHITKLSRKTILSITKYIVITIFFIVGMVKGIITILTKENGNQINANTPVNISEKSKISPKNTPTFERDDFGYPDRSVRE